MLIFYADKLMVMGNSKNLRVFNFTILFKSRKSQKFDAREIYMFYSAWHLMRPWSFDPRLVSMKFMDNDDDDDDDDD